MSVAPFRAARGRSSEPPGRSHNGPPTDVDDVAKRLKELEANGIVRRQVLPDAPVRVQYELTAKGRALQDVIVAIAKWAEAWMEPLKPTAAHRTQS